MTVHTLTPDGTAYEIGVCADVVDLYRAVNAAIDGSTTHGPLDLVLSIRPHARDEDLAELGSVAGLVHDIAQDRDRVAWVSFARFPFDVRIRFEVSGDPRVR